VINGAWQLSAGHRRGGGPDRTDGAVSDLLELARAGLTAFDGADIYTGVEELLGAARRRWRGAEPLRVHTKLVPDLAVLPHLSRELVERSVDRSLRRLGVDRLDLVQLHWWDYRIPGTVETAGWLDALRREGKIRHLGATNFDAPRLAAILDSGVELVSHQVQYSLLDRRPEGAMADLARTRNVGLLCYGTLAGGFLSERWLGRPEPREPAAELPNRSLTKYKLILDELGPWELFQELLRVLARIGEKHGVSLSAVALRWVLDRPGVAAVILGVPRAERLRERLADTLRVFDLRLDERDRAAVDRVLAESRGPGGPVYGLERVPGGRHAAIMRYDLSRV
jgi:aryl-alcohol dehydrogenase-like predicted oxidoreductase